MGCCLNKQIESLSQKRLPFLSSFSASTSIDEAVITIENTRLNPLSFCLISGNVQNFAYLKDKMNASVYSMELLFEEQGFNSLDILIEKGSFDFLVYYFPIYKKLFPQRFVEPAELETSDSISNPRNSYKIPIHTATERGFLDIISFIHSQFSGTYVPDKYNLHYIEEHSGENSALIACKKCHLGISKFLYSCGADFSVKSKRLESALQLSAFGSKNKEKEGFELIRFLVEVVRIDVSFQYEEVLLILNNEEIARYFEGVLFEKGIRCSKKEVENKYSLSSYDRKNKVLYGNAFEFTSGALSSIDANLTVGASITSFIQELDSHL